MRPCLWWLCFGLVAADATQVKVIIGTNHNPANGRKCVDAQEDVYCAPDSGNRGKREGYADFDDTFHIVVEAANRRVCATRTDLHLGAPISTWGLDLVIYCNRLTTTSTATTTSLTATSATTTTSMTSTSTVTTTTTSTTSITTTTTTTTTVTTSTTSSSSTFTTTTSTTTTSTTTTSTTTATTSTTTTSTSTSSTSSTRTATTGTTTTTTSTSSTSSTRTATTGTSTTTTSTSSTTGTETSSTRTATTGTTTSTSSSTTGTNTSSTKTATTVTTTTSSSSTTETNTSSTRTATTVTTTNTSATSSTTGTNISSTETATTVTTTTITMESTLAALVDRVDALEASLVASLVGDNATTFKVQADGLTIVASKLDAAAVAAAGGNLNVPLEDSEVAVTVPASLFSSLGLGEEPVVITVASFDEGFAVDGSEPEVQVAATVSINLLSLAGRRMNVANLPDPIKLVMPVNYSTGLECVYWDEDSSGWATNGMELGSTDKGVVECKATHLTIFAAISRGFVNTFACSQVTLLNADSIKELAKGKWHRTVGALAFWCLLASFMLLMSVAAWLDWRRWRQGRSDENLLVPLQVERQEERHDSRTAKRSRLSMCAHAAGRVTRLWRRTIAAVMALFEPVGPKRGHDGAPVGGRVGMLVHHLTSTVLVISARRQVAASLGVSGGVSSLIMEDDDIFDVVLSHRTRELDPYDAGLGQTGGASSATLDREGAWGQLHQDMEAKIDAFMEASARWSALPGTVWLLFLHHNPLSVCLVHCAFTSCKQRVLLLEVRLIGSLMLVTVFFTATGVPKKQGRSLDCVADDPFEIVGRILAVGTASLLIAGIPAFIFRSLCTRGLKKFEYEGCPKWKRQLKIWRMQDRAIWILGLLYLAFCVFFVCLFLANVDQLDHASWLLSGLTSVVQKTILVPLAVAVTLPLVATVCLQLTSCHRRTTKSELVSALRLQFKSRVNMNMTVGMI